MICKECGYDVPEGTRICPECGFEFDIKEIYGKYVVAIAWETGDWRIEQ
mgnify:CR=1 FL=1